MALELAQRRLARRPSGSARTCGTIGRTWRLCSCADEVPREQLAVGGDLLAAGPGRGSRRRASTPAVGERRQVLARRRTWWRRGSRPRPALAAGSRRGARRSRARMRSRFARDARGVAGRRSAQPCDPRLPPGARRLRGGGRRSARRRSCSRRRRRPRATPAASRRSRAIARRSIVRLPPRAGAERVVHLRADLVAAARPRTGPITAASSPSRAELAQRAHALLEHPAGEAAPAGVDHRDGARAPPSATGRQSAASTIAPTPRQRGRLAVGALEPPRRRVGRGRGAHDRARAVPCTW